MDYTRDFVHGTQGDDVRAFQTNLMNLGYDLPKYGADGVYGSETEGAARSWAHDGHTDHCWDACPVWFQEEVEAEASEPDEPVGWLPEGRGMWIQSMNTIDGAAEAEAVVNEVNLKFVIVQVLWQYNTKESNQYNWPDDLGLGITQSYGCTENAREVVTKFREMGVEVIPFAYPVPGKHSEVIEALQAFAAEWDSPTVVIDPEAEWKSESGAYKDEALDLSSMMSEAFESWGMSTYGACWYHRSFPYAEFNTATYGLPQTYTPESFGTEEKYGRAIEEWTAYGYLHQVGLYGTYKSGTRQILTVCASFDPSATAGWKWGTTSEVEWDEINNILPDGQGALVA